MRKGPSAWENRYLARTRIPGELIYVVIILWNGVRSKGVSQSRLLEGRAVPTGGGRKIEERKGFPLQELDAKM